ncbi:hypothetical protein [uncultured Paludibaculum sp.]|uniref:WD40/YVTN/BNR-like repeat-containing protein n=1 Tax=uncultured Paludibaculum sp. TaxID=1765020 RepID=UPI002AAB0423|nr:hypothetical protein [uncultured Paludibaculum sp.]
MKLGLTAILLLAAGHSLFAVEKQGVQAVFRSTDRGRSWVRSDQGIPDSSRINAFASMGDSYFAGTDTGIYVSRDEAASWQAIPGEAANSGRILSFAVLGTQIYAGTDRSGLLVSKDGGRTWIRHSSFPGTKVLSMLGDGGNLYAGTDEQGVLFSIDSGRTWTSLRNGLPDQPQIFALSAVNGRVFAGLYAKGLYAWNELQQRWIRSGDVSPLVLTSAGGLLVAGHNPGGILWSIDGGSRWAKSVAASGAAGRAGELTSNAPVWAMGSDQGMLLAGAADGIYRSEDGGRTWTRALQGLPPESPGISFLITGRLILAGTIVEP